MPFTHHSHSGQFCGHAKNTLEEVVQAAIAKGFHNFSLTEHIPRSIEDFYPEEADVHTEESLENLFKDYTVEAQRIREAYASKIRILFAFESEWIRPSDKDRINSLIKTYQFDFFIGSVHHMHTIPIDFDRATYERARSAAGGTDERLFEDYFDSQYEMLQALTPPLVGHFDLIRLLSDHRDSDFKDMKGVWERIERNLKYVQSYGGILELNSAGLRKGLAEPYPCLPICQTSFTNGRKLQMFLSMGGRFALSDDSHGIEQVGTNYHRLLAFVQRAGIREIYYADRDVPLSARNDTRFPHAGFLPIAVDELRAMPFWTLISQVE
ncbi:histidinol-phosphatase [Aaosphaeria arxii CBS 175.79]|uniref:Histidinol-phosphatase n=1 Tax=Aaosphaeria arxii CBS 175.79 TaxID=1450172 RepID=A0A6A5Y246_9PLEO|nr:histidinol-phosphatase [Aaosphaeria arxii CBS 175.79]KAF2019309.1 histidinol-phosphatase [Aaosphaeria arxii CBS 175.79]